MNALNVGLWIAFFLGYFSITGYYGQFQYETIADMRSRKTQSSSTSPPNQSSSAPTSPDQSTSTPTSPGQSTSSHTYSSSLQNEHHNEVLSTLGGGQNVTTDEYVKSHFNIVGQVVYDLLSPSPVPSGLLIQPTNNEVVYLEVDVILPPTNNSTGVVALSTPGLRGSISTWSNDTSEPIYLELPVQPHVPYTDDESQHNLPYGPMEVEWVESSTKFGYWGSATPIPNVQVGAVEAIGDVSISGGGGGEDGGNSDTPGDGGSGNSGGSFDIPGGGGLSGGGDGSWGAPSTNHKDVFAGILTGLGGGRPGSSNAPAQQAVQINESVQYHTLPERTCVTIVTIDGDNHCIFHSMSLAYNQLDPNAPQEDVLSGRRLRERLALDHLQNPQILESAGIRGPVNRHQYVQRMLDTNFWGGDIEINQFAQLYSVGVVVYEPGVNGVFHPTRAVGPEIEGNAIHLMYDGSHYNVLLPIDCDELERLNEPGGNIGPMLNGEQYRQMRTQRDQASMQQVQHAGPSMQSSSITVNKGTEGKENLPGNGSTGGPRTRSAAKKAAKVVTFASSVVTSSLQGYGNMMLPSGQGQTLSPPLSEQKQSSPLDSLFAPPVVPGQGQSHAPLDAQLPNGKSVKVKVIEPQSPAFLELVNDIRGMDGYEESREMIEPLLNAVRQVDGDTTHFVMYFGKCPRENLWNAEGYTSHAEGRAMEDNASWRGLQVIDSAIPPSNINYGNGLNGILINARPVCIRTDGHCLGYRSDEVARNKAFVERIGRYLAELEVPTLLLNVGGSGCNTFFTHLNTCLFTSVGDISPHMCSTTAWLWKSYDSPKHQLTRVSQKLKHTCRCIEEFKTKFLAPRGVDVSLPSLFDIASNSDVTAFVGNSHSGVDVQKAKARQTDQCRHGQMAAGKSLKGGEECEDNTEAGRLLQMAAGKSLKGGEECEDNTEAGRLLQMAAGKSVNCGEECEDNSHAARLLGERGMAAAGKSVKGGVECADNTEAAQLLGKQGGTQRAKNVAADLEKKALDGESGIHRVKCDKPINRPVELPDGYTRKDFLTGDQTWECPYPDCMVTIGDGKGKPRIFDSSSSVDARKSHISTCKKKYEKTCGTSAKCGFERLGRPNKSGYFSLTCERCQAAGGHRPPKHSKWDDLGETTEVGLPCNENEDNEADSSDGDTETEDWDLAHVYTIKEMEKEGRQMCEEDNCDRVACCRWESDNDQWFLCLDCQARVFEGPTWPDEMPIDCMSEDHRNYIATHCSDNLDPDMPDLPTGEESEEGLSESESEEESSESGDSYESSDEEDEEEYEPAPKKRRKY